MLSPVLGLVPSLSVILILTSAFNASFNLAAAMSTISCVAFLSSYTALPFSKAITRP